MGNFAGPPQMGFDPKRRILPGVLSSSPRRAQPTRPLAPSPGDIPGTQPVNNQPMGRINMPSNPINRSYANFGAGGDSPGAGGTSSPLGTSMGNNAAANVGMSGLLSALSGIPAAMSAYGMGIPGGTIANTMLGNTANAMFGPMGIANSLLGTAYSAYQGSKAATSQGLTSTGTAAADATKSVSSPLGLAGNLYKYVANLFNPYSTSQMTEALSAARRSDEARRVGFGARLGQGLTGLTTPGAMRGFTPDSQAMAALASDLFGQMSPEDAIMGMPAYGEPGGISGRQGGVGDMTAIGGRWGGVVGHQGEAVGGNQGGDPGTGVGYGGGFGDIGSPTGQGEGDDW